MNRRAFPQFGMSRSTISPAQPEGVAVVPFMDTVAREPQRLQPHYHEFFQMFLLQGRARVMHDFVEFEASGTTLVFLSPGQIHTVKPARGLGGTTISFTQAFFDGDAPPPSLLLTYPFFFAAETRPWLTIPPSSGWRAAEDFALLQREYDAAQPGAAEVMRATLRIILVRANRLYAQAHPAREISRAKALVRQFHLAVEQHFREKHAVADYARELGVTTNHLHDVVREETGHAAGELIRERRLLDAKRLLLHSDLTVAEIGYQLGFPDPSYFSRFFRRSTELAPAEFREQIREKYHPKRV